MAGIPAIHTLLHLHITRSYQRRRQRRLVPAGGCRLDEGREEAPGQWGLGRTDRRGPRGTSGKVPKVASEAQSRKWFPLQSGSQSMTFRALEDLSTRRRAPGHVPSDAEIQMQVCDPRAKVIVAEVTVMQQARAGCTGVVRVSSLSQLWGLPVGGGPQGRPRGAGWGPSATGGLEPAWPLPGCTAPASCFISQSLSFLNCKVGKQRPLPRDGGEG